MDIAGSTAQSSTVAALQPLYDKLLAAAPRAALVVGLLFLGLVAAALARRVCEWLVRRSGLETLSEKLSVAKLLYAAGYRQGVAKACGQLVWLACVLLTFAAIADVLQLPAVSALIALLVRYLPRLLATSLILLAGLALAALVRNVVRSVGQQRKDLESAGFVAQLCYYVIITVTVTWAADQAGLETELVRWLILLVAGLLLGSVALSFGLGARRVFHNLAARHYYERMLRPGDRVSVAGHHGVVSRFSAIALVLQTDQGQEVVIGCGRLLDESMTVEPLPQPVVEPDPADRSAAAVVPPADLPADNSGV